MNAKIEVAIQGPVATITLRRPEVRNAFDQEMWQGLLASLRDVRRDARIRAVVLTGGDSFFSAGGDVSSMKGSGGSLTEPVERLAIAHEVLREIAASDAPVIAAVEKYALGVAWGLVLGCDLVVAGRSAFFQAPFALRGLVADAATAWSLPRRLGQQRAMRYLLLAERMSVEAAHVVGLVSHVVDDGKGTATAAELAGELARGPRESNALTKSLARRSESLDLEAFLEAERIAVALGAHGDDAAEGRIAFTEKRPPEFP
jgi:2-(1,2-epoxy-1,2-dihydrophenyl)acetyl-CoA isomerase